ncbi:MAG: hypothetical protein EBW54_13015 [Betaproteobacteria bacterium]|nr:hypothetical protein [Betaproteobacteria bacterium]
MGSRSIQAQLNRQGIAISRVRVRALMRSGSVYLNRFSPIDK